VHSTLAGRHQQNRGAAESNRNNNGNFNKK